MLIGEQTPFPQTPILKFEDVYDITSVSMGGGKEDKNRTPQFIEVEAPEFLSPNQNFFDQWPFKEIIKDSVSTYSAEETMLRRLLAFYSDHYPTPRASSYWYRAITPAMSKEIALKAVRKGSWGTNNWVKRDEKQKYMDAIADAVDKLEPFPQWQAYVSGMCSRGDYKRDGIPEEGHFPIVETYPHWLSLQIEAEKRSKENQPRQVLLGIDDIFPQDFSDEAKAPGISTHSQKVATRRWRILTATNLVPERKNKIVKSN